MTPDQQAELIREMDEARALRSQHRWMRVTLECGHLRLMEKIHTIMGIGAQTSCRLCPHSGFLEAASRTVVNVEETGKLADTWRPKGVERADG